MIFIAAPSKTQKCEKQPTISPNITTPQLLTKSDEIISTLKQFSHKELATLLKTSPALTQSAYQCIHNFSIPFTKENAEPAILLFKGDAYSAITPNEYSDKEMNYVQQHLRILCALYGIIRPLDLMQKYRLEMQAKLAVGDSGNLYQFWRESVSGILAAEIAGSDDKTIVNLASTEYSKVIDQKIIKEVGGKMINIIFQQSHPKKGYKTIPIHSKRARGLMIHYAITKRLAKAASLRSFTLDNYHLEKELSTETDWVYRRATL